MIRIVPAVLIAASLAGCASPRVSLEGLRPRAAESIDPRIPLPTEAVGKPVDRSLAGQAAAAEAAAASGVSAFDALLPRAEAAASAAGAKGSESWIAAEQLLSALTEARAPLTRALADVDTLMAERIGANGDVGVSDRAVLAAAAGRLAAVDARQRARLDALQARLSR